MSVSVAEPVHPLVGDLVLGRHGAEGTPGIMLDAPARDVVQLLARRGQKISAMPGPGRSAATDFGTAIWLQPGVWAIVAPRGPAGALAGRLAEEFGDRAAVVDQSHGRTVIGIAGPAARKMLAKGIRVDLHPSVFKVGDVAVTECAHLGVALLRADETRYELVVMSTFARELWHFITESAAEFGYIVA